MADFTNMTFPVKIQLKNRATSQSTTYAIKLKISGESVEPTPSFSQFRDDDFLEQFPDIPKYKSRDEDVFSAGITKLNITGLVIITFSDPLKFVTIEEDVTGVSPLEELSSEAISKYFRLTVDWKNSEFEEGYVSYPNLSWEYLKYDSKEGKIYLRIVFDEPYLVSQGHDLVYDRLNVTFTDAYFFRRLKDNKPLHSNYTTVSKEIPPQIIGNKDFELLNKTASFLAGFQDTTSFFIFANLVMNLPKSLFWSLHNNLELMSIEVEYGSLMPANAVYVFESIREKSSYDVIPINDLIDSVFVYNKELSEE